MRLFDRSQGAGADRKGGMQPDADRRWTVRKGMRRQAARIRYTDPRVQPASVPPNLRTPAEPDPTRVRARAAGPRVEATAAGCRAPGSAALLVSPQRGARRASTLK